MLLLVVLQIEVEVHPVSCGPMQAALHCPLSRRERGRGEGEMVDCRGCTGMTRDKRRLTDYLTHMLETVERILIYSVLANKF